MDGQYVCLVLDQKSRKTLSFSYQTESRRSQNPQRDRDHYLFWKNCPREKNLADLGSRGAGTHKTETGGWFTAPKGLLDEKQWPHQLDFICTKDVNDAHKPVKEENLNKL